MSTDGKQTANTVTLAVGALGVVYGDLGTSPLYSIREAFLGSAHRLAVDRVNVLGAVSIIVWTLVLIIALKYVVLVLRADNNGEGGILALTALVERRHSPNRSGVVRTGGLVLLGLFGTALLFGDGMITPSISVLSAVEGLKLVSPSLGHSVVPIAVVILIGLFGIQRFGTKRVGRIFGVVMIVWFSVLALLGIVSIVRTPDAVNAVNPVYAVRYFAANGFKGFLSMGSLFLVVTGGEALYADMGHFGRRPITIGWFSTVMPALLLTYLGIGGLLLRRPEAIESPFFLLAPAGLQLPLVLLATAATVIASQALISGVFSLTAQGVRLGYAPRTRIVSTSPTARGQIYVPMVNWALMIAFVGLVVVAGSSSRLAAAFGLSVTGTMFVTTILFAVHARRHWRVNIVVVSVFSGVILAVEGTFLAANAFKIPDGGWFPIAAGLVVLTLFTTWRTGRALVGARIGATRTPLHRFVEGLAKGDVIRVPGSLVLLYSHPGTTPPSLAAIVRATGALHENVYVTSIVTDDVPAVHPVRRVNAVPIGQGVVQVSVHYGFMEGTPVADDLATHLALDKHTTDYVLGRESIISTSRPGMARWREVLYRLMVRNAADVAAEFHLPADRVLEVGVRVEV